MINPKYKKIIQAAEAGGKILKQVFNQNLKAECQIGDKDCRISADKKSENAILKILKKEFPDYNIFTEESGIDSQESEDYTFIVDPLDGTNNFIMGTPYFSTVIALLYKEETIFSVICNPITGHTYHAIKNEGAFLNDTKINVNNNKDIKNASVVYACGYHMCNTEYSSDLIKKLKYDIKIKRFLDFWCPTLDFCMLASGKIESIINNNNDIFDYIAGKLIAKEAGAVVTDFKGKKQRDKDGQFLASNCKEIHNKILKLL